MVQNILSVFFSMLFTNSVADILIFDSKNDLNVYKGLGDDGKETSCCGAKPAAAAGSCGAKIQRADPSVLSAEHADIDFNEWAGECSQELAGRPEHDADTRMLSRLIPYICPQAIDNDALISRGVAAALNEETISHFLSR